jgi:hypothetical protein
VSTDDIHLALRRTGGLAGLAMEATLDTKDVDPEQAAQIAAALDRVDLAGTAPPPDDAPDRFAYRLDVRRGDASSTLTFGERQVPEPLRPLVRLLEERAAPAPRSA